MLPPFGLENTPALQDAPMMGEPTGWAMGGGNGGSPDFSIHSGPVEVEPPEFTKKEQDEAMEYICSWIRASRDYVRAKQPDWKLLKLLYEDQAYISDLLNHSLGHRQDTSQSRTPDLIITEDPDDWKYRRAYGISHLVDRVRDELVPAIFEGPEWLTIALSDRLGPEPVRDPAQDYPLAQRMQAVATRDFRRGMLKNTISRCAKHWAAYGTGILTTSWEQRHGLRWLQDRNQFGIPAGKTYPEPYLITDFPLVTHIPVDKFLPDRAATTPDVTRWSGVGYRVTRSYDQVMQGYHQGRYNLNLAKFKDKFEHGQKGSVQSPEDLNYEPAREIQSDERSFLELVVWHGVVPFSSYDGLGIEVIAVIATPIDTDPSPGSSLLLTLAHGPIGNDGVRPFFVGHYSPDDGPLGKSLVECNLTWIRLITEMQCILVNGLRLTSTPTRIVSERIARQLEQRGGYSRPGDYLIKSDGYPMADEFDTADIPNFNAELAFRLLQYGQTELEKGTVTSTFQGVSSREQTATEAQMLQAQSQRPVKTRTDDFVDTLLTPAINKAINLMQVHRPGDSVMLMDSQGQRVPVEITQEELISGRFEAAVTLTRQDTTRIAKAQAIERMFPNLMQVAPQIEMREGVRIKLGEVTKRWVDFLGVDGSDRIFEVISSEMQMLLDQNQQLMMQNQQMQEQLANTPPPQSGKQPKEQNGPPPQEGGGPPPGGMPPEMAGGSPPPPLGENGGPMGSMPTDDNVMAQLYQMMAAGQMPPEA